MLRRAGSGWVKLDLTKSQSGVMRDIREGMALAGETLESYELCSIPGGAAGANGIADMFS